jgi:ribosomal protein S18 acetylase RimI-like enzyme
MAAIASLIVDGLSANDTEPLAALFEALATDAETVRFFHPHPLTPAYAVELCRRVATCRDRYFVARYRSHLIGYGMLRGWDEGFAVPSFGACVYPDVRGVGLGQALLAHAVQQSIALGAPRLRLTVYKANERGIHVYRKFGFVFTEKNEHELVGLLDLTQKVGSIQRPVDVDRLESWHAQDVRRRNRAA